MSTSELTRSLTCLQENKDAAWFYADPKPAAANIKDHVAFWKGVKVENWRARRIYMNSLSNLVWSPTEWLYLRDLCLSQHCNKGSSKHYAFANLKPCRCLLEYRSEPSSSLKKFFILVDHNTCFDTCVQIAKNVAGGTSSTIMECFSWLGAWDLCQNLSEGLHQFK